MTRGGWSVAESASNVGDDERVSGEVGRGGEASRVRDEIFKLLETLVTTSRLSSFAARARSRRARPRSTLGSSPRPVPKKTGLFFSTPLRAPSPIQTRRPMSPRSAPPAHTALAHNAMRIAVKGHMLRFATEVPSVRREVRSAVSERVMQSVDLS